MLSNQEKAQAEIWQRAQEVTQGQIIYFGGLQHQVSNNKISDLNKCSLIFNEKEYTFSVDVIYKDIFEKSEHKEGFQYIARIPTTPFTQTGKQNVILDCPEGSEIFTVNIISGEFPLQHIKLSPGKSGLTASKKELEAVAKAIKTYSSERLWDTNEIWTRPSEARLSTVYGLRRTYNGVLANNYFHKGWDFAGNDGSAVLSPATGEIILIGKESEEFNVHGNCLFIDHGHGLVTGYLHLKEIKVSNGDLVKAGQVIATVGSSGIATGPHLHFGVYMSGENINPEPFFEHTMR